MFNCGGPNDFAPVAILDQAAWYKQAWAEDDGLEKYYRHYNRSTGQFNYLLSNNMTYKDRTQFDYLFKAHKRADYIVHAFSFWAAFETLQRVSQLKKLAIGWKVVSLFGIAWSYKQVGNYYTSARYNPLIGAYLRKY